MIAIKKKALPILDDIQVASPCPAEWADMVGSDTVRFCASCQKNVYNLSGMQRDDAVELLRATEGRVCVRFFRRADGTVLTEDCPVGVQLMLRRAKKMTLAAAAVSLGAVAALLAFLGGSLVKKTCDRIDGVKTSIEDVITTPDDKDDKGGLMGKVSPRAEPVDAVPVMGAPPPTTSATPMLGQAVAPLRELKGKVALPTPPQPQPQPQPHLRHTMGAPMQRHVQPVRESVVGK